MENNNKQMPEASSEKIPLKFVVEGKEYQTCNQYITGAELKQIAGIPLDTELFLSISKPYEDELIENEKTVNLARPETEYFFVKRSCILLLMVLFIHGINNTFEVFKFDN